MNETVIRTANDNNRRLPAIIQGDANNDLVGGFGVEFAVGEKVTTCKHAGHFRALAAIAAFPFSLAWHDVHSKILSDMWSER